jgi:hypothetical protein
MARLNVLRFRQDFKKDKTKETEQKISNRRIRRIMPTGIMKKGG